MDDLQKIAEELREKQRKQEEQERKQYRDQFWSEAQNTPTRPDAPLK